jgi:hypothetical protein
VSTLPSLQVLSSLLDWFILEGAIDQRIHEGVGHAEEEDTRLQILAQPFVGIGEHKDQHHSVIWRPTDDKCGNNHNRNP